MNRKNHKRTMKWGAGLIALVLAAAIPVLAMAEAATQTPAAPCYSADGTNAHTLCPSCPRRCSRQSAQR